MGKFIGLVAALAVIASPAVAQDVGEQGVASGQGPTVRYVQGAPTLDVERENGGVLVTPLAADHGRITLGVAVYNHGLVPANFGVENVAATVGGEAVPLLSAQQLVAKARHRAFWAQVGTIAATAIVAGIASTAYNTYTYRTVGITRSGTVLFSQGLIRDNTPGVIGAAAATGAGAGAIVAIRSRLDQTIARVNQNVLQTTTVDPEAGFSGRIVLDKPANRSATGSEVRLTIRWNGADYAFAFRGGGSGRPLVPEGATTIASAMPFYASAPMPSTAAALFPVTPAAPLAPIVPAGRVRVASLELQRHPPIQPRLSEAERYQALLRAAQPQ